MLWQDLEHERPFSPYPLPLSRRPPGLFVSRKAREVAVAVGNAWVRDGAALISGTLLNRCRPKYNDYRSKWGGIFTVAKLEASLYKPELTFKAPIVKPAGVCVRW